MKVLLTAEGLLGYAIKKVAPEFPEYEIIVPSRVFDLINHRQTCIMMEAYKPDIVIHNAALVGGVKINSEKPETMFFNNITMTTNVINAASKFAKKIVSFGSGCMFDKEISTDHIHCGVPYEKNYAYGWAKRMAHINLKSCLDEHKIPYLYLIFLSLYGPNDNFSLENGHVIPSLIHKTYLSKDKLTVWGDGSPKRDVMFSYDAARIVLSLLSKDTSELVVATGKEISIKKIAEAIAGNLEVEFDSTKPSGQKSRGKVDLKKFYELLPNFKFTTFEEGIRETVDWFSKNFSNARK